MPDRPNRRPAAARPTRPHPAPPGHRPAAAPTARPARCGHRRAHDRPDSRPPGVLRNRWHRTPPHPAHDQRSPAHPRHGSGCPAQPTPDRTSRGPRLVSAETPGSMSRACQGPRPPGPGGVMLGRRGVPGRLSRQAGEGRPSMTWTGSMPEGPGPREAEVFFDARRGIYYARPVLRGWLHVVWFGLSVVAGPLLLAWAHGARRDHRWRHLRDQRERPVRGQRRVSPGPLDSGGPGQDAAPGPHDDLLPRSRARPLRCCC